MSDRTADVVVVGAGVCGLLVASELADAGVEVAIVERGARRSHAEQLRTGEHAGPGALPNHEIHPHARPYPWTYVYGVGGSTLAWSGVHAAVRRGRLPAARDLRGSAATGRSASRSRRLTTRPPSSALGVAGPDGPGAPHPLAPVDELIGPHLAPLRAAPAGAPERRDRPAAAVHGLGDLRTVPVRRPLHRPAHAPGSRLDLPARRHAARAHGGLATCCATAAA